MEGKYGAAFGEILWPHVRPGIDPKAVFTFLLFKTYID